MTPELWIALALFAIPNLVLLGSLTRTVKDHEREINHPDTGLRKSRHDANNIIGAHTTTLHYLEEDVGEIKADVKRLLGESAA